MLNVVFSFDLSGGMNMADSSLFGKALMGQRPKGKKDEMEQLDNLDYYIFPKADPDADPEKVNDDFSETLSDSPESDESIEGAPEVVDDVEVLHSHSIDDEGNVREFSIYDPDIPDDLEVGTSTAAKALRVTEQTIRNYCNDFSEFLEIRLVNGRRKIKVETLKKLDIIMQVKEERKYDREQMRAYLRNEGRESLMVTEAERMNALVEAVSKKVIDEMVGLLNGENGVFPRIDAQSRQLANEINQLSDLLSAEKKEDHDRHLDRISELEEKLNEVQREYSGTADIIREKDEIIAKLQQDNEMLREASTKKRRWFQRK